MTGSTINYGHPYPEGGDKVAVHSDIERLAKSVDAREKIMAQEVDGAIPYRGWLDEFTVGSPEPFADLPDGRYGIRYQGTAEAFGLPQNLMGDVLKESSGNQITLTYRPNDAGSSWGTKLEWVRATNSGGTLRDRWQQLEKSIMRTAPVVLTSPAGDYLQTDTRGAVRLPFTVPTTIGKVRVHMRPWNFRTREEWGPAKMSGVMIAQQNGDDSGSITGSRWYAPNVDGQIVDGTEEWVSDWFHVGLTPGNTYLLSYAAEWQDDSRNLVSGQCWSNFDLAKWDTTEPANYQSGWGGFTLNPMDVWIECEAPSTVPVWGYFESSNGVFAGANSVFGAYPNVHARKNGAFAAVTAAGGWSPMDETFHDAAIITRFGYPARILDRMYLGMGANIEVRGASAQDAIAELDRWMTVRTPALGNPPIYLLTQISRYTSEETTDTAGTLSEWNEWIRYEAPQRNDVAGVIDQAAIFQDPEKPWTARVELRNSPTDVHFGAMGQKLRAQALDGEVHLPQLTQKNPDDLPWRVGFEWAGEPHASESIKYVGGREVARNRAINPSFETSGSAGLQVGSEVTTSDRTSVPSRVSQGTYSGILSWIDDGSTSEVQGIVQQETDVLPGQWVAVSVDMTTTSGGELYAAGIISERGDSNNHIVHHYPGEYAQVGKDKTTTFTYVVQMTDAEVRRVRAGLRFSGTPGSYSLPGAWGYIDGYHIAVADTEVEARKQVAEYFDGDTEGWDRLDRLEEEAQSTPWRDITSLLGVRPTGGRVYVRRSPEHIEYSIAGVTISANGVILEWGSLPEEYRPTESGAFPIYGENGSTAVLTPNYGGGLSLTQGWAEVPYWGTGRLPTARPAPTVLPGVEAGWGEQPDLALSPADAAQMIGRVYTNVDGLAAIIDRLTYDSGWRDVSGLLPAGLAKSTSNGRCNIKRKGDRLLVDMHLTVSADSVTNILTLPVEWRPDVPRLVPFTLYTTETANSALPGTAGLGYLGAGGATFATGRSLPNPGTVMFYADLIISRPLPTTLIGDPA